MLGYTKILSKQNVVLATSPSEFPHCDTFSNSGGDSSGKRWGEIVFSTKNKDVGWDGKYKGAPQSTQVFVWIVEGVGVDGRLYTKKGTSTLIR